MSLLHKNKKPIPNEGTPQDGLARLLNLFYGLAISTGFGATLRKLLQDQTPLSDSQFLFLLFAFLVAMCDWVIYHFAAARFSYQSLFRLALDLMFPIGLFVISLVVDRPETILTLLFGYFAASSLYSWETGSELKNLPGWNVPLGVWCAIVCIGSALLLCNGKVSKEQAALCFGVLAALPWLVFWFRWLRKNEIVSKQNA